MSRINYIYGKREKNGQKNKKKSMSIGMYEKKNGKQHWVTWLLGMHWVHETWILGIGMHWYTKMKIKCNT